MAVFTSSDNLVFLACPFRVDFREGGKLEYPEKETPEPQETWTSRTPSHMKQCPSCSLGLGYSVTRGPTRQLKIPMSKIFILIGYCYMGMQMGDSGWHFNTNSRDCWDRKSEKYLECKRQFTFELVYEALTYEERGWGWHFRVCLIISCSTSPLDESPFSCTVASLSKLYIENDDG